jgi:hypothetical protein
MACILKIPVDGAKGVVTFTTQEQRVINKNSALQSALINLRRRYVVGLHFNWHNHQFTPDQNFDFFMAGAGDLIPVADTPFRLFPLDACNFTPAIYAPDNTPKFWDILVVGNPVFFKRPEVVLRTVRKLFDQAGRKFRVLYICPMPQYRVGDISSVFYDVRKYYESMFSKEERNWFTLLTTTFNSPFPFDRQTLSVFFRNSRVFLHCATDERRCRIAAYAWCAGLPVVAYPSVASILPPNLQVEPGYFRVERDENYVPSLLRALESSENFDPFFYRQALSETYMVSALDRRLADVFSELGYPYSDNPLLEKNLDIRLGWHHQCIGGESNGLRQPLEEFMRILEELSLDSTLLTSDFFNAEFPEQVLAGEGEQQKNGDVSEIEKQSFYLNPNKPWFRIYRAIIARLRLN